MEIDPEKLATLAAEQETFSLTERQMAEKMLREHLVPAVYSICHLATYAERDETKLKSAQYVVERNLGMLRDAPPLDGEADDALLTLVNAWAAEVTRSEATSENESKGAV